MTNTSAPDISTEKLLRLLQSGKARIAQTADGHCLKIAGGNRPLAAPVVRELLRQRLLVDDGENGLRPATTAERGKPGFNSSESPLYRLRHRKEGKAEPYLTQMQFEAGERLRTDYERSDLATRVTANWGTVRVDGGAHATLSDNRIAHIADVAIDARRRLHQAFDAVGPELAGVLYYVCCIAGGLEQAERFLALPPRSGKAILSLALTRLARHYRLIGRPQSSAHAADVGHWALSDYRPSLTPQPAHRT